MTNLERDLFSLITLVSNVTEAYSACLFLENKRRKTYQLTTYHSLSPYILADASVEMGQGFMGWVLENNEPLSVNQFDKDTLVLGYYSRNEDIKSFMATPLPSSINKGALAIDSKKSWCFTSRDQKILAGFAQQFAYLADGAMTSVQMERRSMNVPAFSKYLNSLRSSENEGQLLNAICQVPRELLPFDACFLVLIDEEAGVPRLVRTSGFGELFLGEITISEHASLAGYVLSKKESLRLPDLKGKKETRPLFHQDEPRFESRSAACFPLISRGEILGCLGFASKRRAQFDASSVQRGEIIAALVADAIANRKNELRWQARLEIDPLTGEQNIEYLHSRLHEIILESEATGRQLALLSIAPDASSGFDDTPEEEVILHLSNSLKPFAAGNDILVRHEGPRFLLLLHDSSQEYAEAVAERIIHVVNHTPFYLDGKEFEITISIGAACFPETAQNSNSLIKSSLAALGFAQKGGAGNQLCFMGGDRSWN
ncbi:MAG: GAF domain-containing protein [Nitrospinae bacterium]|nr:GAF domain-containing protein [Nitrospinota bacterium]